MTRWTFRGNGSAVAAVLVGLMCSSAPAEVKVLGVQFRADRAFPQYRQFWHEDSNDPEAPEGGEGEEVTAKEPLGASVHVLLHNTGAGPVQIQDVALARESLKSAITLSDQRKVRKFGSIYFSKLPPARMQKLVAAGEPIWFKVDPPTIGPGETGQVVVRLRSIPEVQSLDLSLRHAGGSTPVQVPILPDQPRLAGAGFSADLREVCLYWRHTDQGRAPARILLDGQDVTANATLAADPALNIARDAAHGSAAGPGIVSCVPGRLHGRIDRLGRPAGLARRDRLRDVGRPGGQRGERGSGPQLHPGRDQP
jgi:hypothetical protein